MGGRIHDDQWLRPDRLTHVFAPTAQVRESAGRKFRAGSSSSSSSSSSGSSDDTMVGSARVTGDGACCRMHAGRESRPVIFFPLFLFFFFFFAVFLSRTSQAAVGDHRNFQSAAPLAIGSAAGGKMGSPMMMARQRWMKWARRS